MKRQLILQETGGGRVTTHETDVLTGNPAGAGCWLRVEQYMVYRYALAVLVLSCIATATVAHAETVKPIKSSKHDIAGAIFQRNDSVHEDKDGNATTDVVTFSSSDTAFQTGVYKSGPTHEEIKGPQGFPYNEFLYFISGRVRLTSSDGSVMNVNAGEAVTLPKGWIGTFDTQGYTKLYVTYNPDDAKK